MTSGIQLTQGNEFAEHDEMLRQRALLVMMAAVVLTAIALLWTAAIWPPESSLEPLPLVGALALSVTAAEAARRWTPRFATVVLVLFLAATLVGVILGYDNGLAAAGFAILVLAATSAGDWRHGLFSAIVGTVAVLAVSLAAPETVTLELGVQALLLIWGTLGLAWLGAHRLQTAYAWAWEHYELAHVRAEEAQQQRGELVRLTKSLNEACDRLERLNVELQEARAAAESARRLKAEFAATVGHELRTPINLIVGFAELMVGDDRAFTYGEALPDTYRRDIEAIHRNATHISHLIDDILDLSQVDAHRMALRKEWVDVRTVIQDAVANVAELCTDEGLNITIDVPDDLPLVHADEVRIRQVLINLLYNAIRFTHRGGISVRAQSNQSSVVISVSDTGVGIPPTELPRLFEEFRYVTPSVRGRGGSGLGLAVCRRFIELHGGSIWAESEVGRGSTFSFSLPLSENVVAIPGRVPPETRVRMVEHAPRVGVVDRAGDATRILQRYLDGYDVLPVPTSRSARGKITATDVEAVILTSSAEASEWMEAAFGDSEHTAPPIVTCALRTREYLAEALGVADYLVKPVTRERLVQALRRLNRRIRTILAIEDDAEVGELLVRTLRSLSPRYHVAHAREGTAGVRLARRLRPDVILLDLLMPGVDGYTVIKQLRADPDLCAIPVIVVTAKGLDEEVVASQIQLTRPGGLGVGEAMRCLRAILDALLAHGTVPAPPAAIRDELALPGSR